ncbi:MAG: hypothetical protein ABIN13_15340 [Mucilaginibacter sp.]
MDDKVVNNEAMRTLRHDIKNQLSNINLIIGELKYELETASADCHMYLDMLEKSVESIDEMLKNTQQ